MATCECLLCHGFHAATRDRDHLDLMLAALPTGALAIATGQPSGVIVLDAESHAREGEPTGLDVLDDWEGWTHGDAGSLPPTLTARSVSGGTHLYYRVPPGVRVVSGRILPGVDVKGDGGYVGVVSGSNDRAWVDPATPVADAPTELLGWLTGSRRRGTGTGGGSGGAGRPNGYDFEAFARDGCPDGHRDFFFNDLLFRSRRAGASLDELTELALRHWLRVAQPPVARYEMPWEDVHYKVERVFNEIQPMELSAGQSAWVGALVPRPEALTEVPGSVVGAPPTFDEELTQTGNAHRFVRLFADRALFVPGLGWHLWNGNTWQGDELNDVFDATQRVLEELRREQAAADTDHEAAIGAFYLRSSGMDNRRAMLLGAAADPRMKASSTRLDADPMLLVVQNGTLDLRTGTLRDSRPADLNTQVAAVSYDETATCPRWLEHVNLVTQRDGQPDPVMAAYLARWAGYTLTGLVREQKFFFGYGEGNNGKNVFIETLLGMLGSYAIRGSTKILLGSGQEHETVIADLAGVRMAFIDETPHGRINEARLKELTGSSRIRARKIAKDSFEFDARFKLWIAGNNKPRVLDSSKGFWRRLDLVPFDATIPAERRVKDYVGQLREEWPGVLNWALAGLRDYLAIESLGAPGRVAVAGEDYRQEENVFGQFVSECFDLDEKAPRIFVPNNVLNHLYKTWCESQGMKPLAMQALANDWREQSFVREEKPINVWQGWPTRTVSKQRGYVGPPPAVPIPANLRWDGMPEVRVDPELG